MYCEMPMNLLAFVLKCSKLSFMSSSSFFDLLVFTGLVKPSAFSVFLSRSSLGRRLKPAFLTEMPSTFENERFSCELLLVDLTWSERARKVLRISDEFASDCSDVFEMLRF